MSTAVPHHRVDAALHKAARAAAEKAGLTLSAVAEAGLRAYAASAAPGVASAAAAKVATGRLTRAVHTLPNPVASQIAALAAAADPRLDGYLVACRDAGWSYAALGSALGVTRQSVHARVGRAERGEHGDLTGLVAPPPGPGTRASTAVERFDWSVWVDRGVYAVAAEHAAGRAVPMRAVMEQILTDFLSGRLVVDPLGARSDELSGEGR